MTQPTLSVETRTLCKSFGPVQALRGLELAIPQGCMYGLIGPNGSGKTTLFRILVGLTQPTSGEVKVLGARPGSPAARSSIGYMTQVEALYQDLSVDENVRFFGRLYGLKGEALDSAVTAALDLVDLRSRAGSRVDNLSGGMRRRVSLACATVHRPRLLILDEPTVGIDPELRVQFWEAFADWARQGTCLLVSTHHLDEAGHCTQLGLIREGRLIAEGAPGELMNNAHATTMEEAFLSFARRQQ
jgi:ABC-2 type transport system ATP-binding protein